MSSGSSGGNPNDGRVLGAVRAVGVVGVVGVVTVWGGSGHTLAAFKYSLNTYKNLKEYWKRCEWWKWW